MSDEELAVSLCRLLTDSDVQVSINETDIEARIRVLVQAIAHNRLPVPTDLIEVLEVWRGWRSYDIYLRFAYHLALVRLNSPGSGQPICGDGEEIFWPFLEVLKAQGVDTALGELSAGAGEYDLALVDICHTASEAEHIEIPAGLADLLVVWLTQTDLATREHRETMTAAILKRRVTGEQLG